MAGKMIDVRFTIRSILIQCLQHLLIEPEDHDVRPNPEFIAASHRMRLVKNPFSLIHVRNSDALHIGRASGHAVLIELQKDTVEAAGFIMSGSRKPWKTCPLVGASPKNAELGARRTRPVEHGGISSNKLWT